MAGKTYDIANWDEELNSHLDELKNNTPPFQHHFHMTKQRLVFKRPHARTFTTPRIIIKIRQHSTALHLSDKIIRARSTIFSHLPEIHSAASDGGLFTVSHRCAVLTFTSHALATSWADSPSAMRNTRNSLDSIIIFLPFDCLATPVPVACRQCRHHCYRLYGAR